MSGTQFDKKGGGGVMAKRQVTEYSNAADIDPTKIPQVTMNIIADIFYNIYSRSATPDEAKKKTA